MGSVCTTGEVHKLSLESSIPRCWSVPECHLEGPSPSTSLRPRTPPPHEPKPPLLGHCKKSLGGEEGGRGWGGKGCGLRKGVLRPPVPIWGWGEPYKGQLGPDPHLGALDGSIAEHVEWIQGQQSFIQTGLPLNAGAACARTARKSC